MSGERIYARSALQFTRHVVAGAELFSTASSGESSIETSRSSYNNAREIIRNFSWSWSMSSPKEFELLDARSRSRRTNYISFDNRPTFN